MIEVLKIDEWLQKKDDEEMKYFQERLIASLMPLTHRKKSSITEEIVVNYVADLFKDIYGEK